VPQDIAVAGFDGLRSAQLVSPAVTTVRHPMPEIGRSAVEAVLTLIEDSKHSPIRIVLSPGLVVRTSTVKITKK
jgi:LacI family transcriptional regulator